MSTFDTRTWAPAYLADAKVGDIISIHRQRIVWVGEVAGFEDYRETGLVVAHDRRTYVGGEALMVSVLRNDGSEYHGQHGFNCHIDIVLPRWDEFANEHKHLNGGCGVDSRVPEDRALYRIWMLAVSADFMEMADHYIEALCTNGYYTKMMQEAYVHAMAVQV